MAAASQRRKKIPPGIEAQVLTESRRRCCLCFHLDRDTSEKQGQIAHIDRQRSNNAEANLAFLCLPHHNAYDSKTSQSKGFTPTELRIAKKALIGYLQKQSCSDRVPLLLTVQADFNKLTDQERQSILEAILKVAEIKGEYRLVNTDPGSIRFTIEVNVDDAARIAETFNSGRLKWLGVTDVRLNSQSRRNYKFGIGFKDFSHSVSREQAISVLSAPDSVVYLSRGQVSSEEDATTAVYLKRINSKYSVLIVTKNAYEINSAFPLSHELIEVPLGANPVEILKEFLAKVGIESTINGSKALLRLGEYATIPPHIISVQEFVVGSQRVAMESKEPCLCVCVLKSTKTISNTVGIEIMFIVSLRRYYPWIGKLGKPIPIMKDMTSLSVSDAT